jgi:hypothetical protein
MDYGNGDDLMLPQNGIRCCVVIQQTNEEGRVLRFGVNTGIRGNSRIQLEYLKCCKGYKHFFRSGRK